MTSKTRPSIDLLRRLVRYDPETGGMFWRARLEEHFVNCKPENRTRACKAWNKRYADTPVGTPDSGGHLRTLIFGHVTSVHRVAWAVFYGHWPHEIDHVNGCPTDNRIANLRDVPHQQNMRNRRLRADSSTGVNGVYFKNGRYTARIHVDGRPLHLGIFPTLELAIEARGNANIEHGYHQNHGLSASIIADRCDA